jgi:hypothetical protein
MINIGLQYTGFYFVIPEGHLRLLLLFLLSSSKRICFSCRAAQQRIPCGNDRKKTTSIQEKQRALYPYPMKLPLLTAALLLAPLAMSAQTDAMPPERNTPAMPMHEDAKAPVPRSNSLNVTFQGRLTILSVEDLLNLPQVTVHVHNAHRNTDEEYTGPLVSDVLAKAGLSVSKETEPLILHSSLVCTATDHYFVIYSLAEVEPSFTKGQVIVAVMKSGLPDTEGGRIQLINTNGAKPARWVHGLSNLNVMSVAPTQ